MQNDRVRKVRGLLGVLTALTVVVVCAIAQSAMAKPRVTDVRIGAHLEFTRFVLELDAAPAYRVFALADPYRVVIDLPEIDWPTPASEQTGGLIGDLRYGLFTPTTSRVVLDLTGPARLREVFMIPPRDGQGYRLVVDLERTDRPTFLAAELDRRLVSREELPRIRTALPAAPPVPSDPRPTVVIDAGHGGVDPGAIGVSGTYEKVLALDYAKALRTALEGSGRYRVVMTRADDRFIPLRDRYRIAEQAGGDLFVSLHANIHSSGRIRGASVYTLSQGASDTEAAALAAKENKADALGGVELSPHSDTVSHILIDLMQTDTLNLSRSFANMLVDTLGERVKLLNNTHRFAGFAVLKSPSVPSVLVEIGYMSNAEEERQLKTKAHREKVTDGLVASIERFFKLQTAMHNN
ncbi:N-acetylmuramoyl-L-alanine amidase [Algihabitans albus]|uniref:N-acetylmuramoyl-L-alanine amidase n=1 Tax=Algihabitans albus TaxID=2164067 RepID=UPI000E5D4F3A|nr:N-acetylmuramoyl-L-alanine amidase [Algihabitans albus]